MGKNASVNVIADRIRRNAERAGKPIDEIWLENILKEQERKRQRFSNKRTVDLQKRLRQHTNNLNKNKDSIEKHYRLRQHQKRKDSKVGKNLTGLILRRQKCMTRIEKKLAEPQKATIIPSINDDDERTIESKDGWIDLARNNHKPKQKRKTILGKLNRKKPSPSKNIKYKYENSPPTDQISLSGSISLLPLSESIAHMTIAESPMEQQTSSSSIGTKCNEKTKSAKNFVRRKSLVENERLDNGAFSIW